MIKLLNHKRLFNLSIIVSIAFVVILYHYVVSPALLDCKQIKMFQERIALSNNSEFEIKALEIRLMTLEQSLNQFEDPENTFQLITSYCTERNIGLVIEESEIKIESSSQIQTNMIKVDGSFSDILNLVYLIETKLGWVQSCALEKVQIRNRTKVTEALQCEIKFNTVHHEK